MEPNDGLFLFCIACASVYMVPFILGSILFRLSGDTLGVMGGWLTLKPILTTTLGILIFGFFAQNNFVLIGAFIGILPDVVLSWYIARTFAAIFADPATLRSGQQLLILDCARWLTTLAVLFLPGGVAWVAAQGVGITSTFAYFLFLIDIALPTLYGIFAFYVTARRKRMLAAPLLQKDGG